MGYLLSETDLEELLIERTSVEKLTEPDNLCLVTFTGADVRRFLEKKDIKLSEEEIVDLLYKISHDLEHYECWACIESALESEIEAYAKK